MGLSSNTIIHFTERCESLKGILSDNFKLKYCKETIKWTESSSYEFHAPMVSFCDIPLSQIKNHIASYGHYGIGLSRDWAIRNSLNPVLYIQPGSNLSNSYKEVMRNFASLDKSEGPIKEAAKSILDVLRYIKNYEGPLIRRDKAPQEDYRFSDEREWRYVPNFSSSFKPLYLSKDYSNEVKAKAEDSLRDMRLTFAPDDVKYIIIRNDSEIDEFIRHLHDAKNKSYTPQEIARLTTRILTSEQIHKDI